MGGDTSRRFAKSLGEAAAILLPFGEMVIDISSFVFPSRPTSMGAPVRKSQHSTVLSVETHRRYVISGENATECTSAVRLWNGGPVYFPLCESQMRTVWSLLPETIRLPSGENATYHTLSVWPFNNALHCPLCESQMQTAVVTGGDNP